jgi:SPP1 gp7 family putative phage head morphogenesis protein
LTPVTRAIFDGLDTQLKQQAFTLSGAAEQRLIERIRDALADIAQKGGTRQEFERAADELTDAAGVARLNAFTVDTAFNVAMQRAYSQGRLAQMKEPAVLDALPYWQYWTVNDDRVRPEHRVIHLFTARAEDPVWMKIYPPSGFNCRCSVIPIPNGDAPDDADEPGMGRLPLLARLNVPDPSFTED